MTAKIYLNVVDPDKGDTILVWDGDMGKPIFVGEETDESLACGSCKAVLAKYMSTRTFFEKFSAPKRIVIKCGCGAHNVVPSKIG